MTEVDARRGGDEREAAGYWYDDAPGQRDRARRVLESLRTYRAAEAAMRRRTRDSMAMAENELLVLRFLLRKPDHTARSSELVAYLAISSAAVTTMVDKLERTGRVRRVEDPQHPRAVLVRATAHADDEVRETLGRMHDRMYAVAADMPAEQQEAVVAFLHAMTDAVDRVEPAARA